MSAPKTFDHLIAALPLPDAGFDEFWQNYLAAMPAFTDGATIELTRDQLRTLKKLAFLAGREAQGDDLVAALGVEPIASR